MAHKQKLGGTQRGKEEEEDVRKDRRRSRRRRGEVLRGGWGKGAGGFDPKVMFIRSAPRDLQAITSDHCPHSAPLSSSPFLPASSTSSHSFNQTRGGSCHKPASNKVQQTSPPPVAECLPGAMQHAQASLPLVLPPRLLYLHLYPSSSPLSPPLFMLTPACG